MAHKGDHNLRTAKFLFKKTQVGQKILLFLFYFLQHNFSFFFMFEVTRVLCSVYIALKYFCRVPK